MNRCLLVIACLVIFAGCNKDDGSLTSPAAVQKQAAIDDKKVADYIAANNIPATKVGTAAGVDTIGVWYVITTQGTDAALYTSSTSVTVGYTGRDIGKNDAVFTATGDIHPAFVLGQVIKGWQLGIQASKVKTGGTVRILMSSRYAYGPYAQAAYGLEANALLDFDITIFDVTN